MRQFLWGISITRDRGVSFISGGGGGPLRSAGGSGGMLPLKIFENLSF